MTRTHLETAQLLSDSFDQSSEQWLHDRSQNSTQVTPYLDAGIARMSAALGGDEKILHALAGVTLDSKGDGQDFQGFVLTDALIYHSVFAAVEGAEIHIKVLARNAITGLTVTNAGPFTRDYNPARLKFTASYKDGEKFAFPLWGSRSKDMAYMSEVYEALKADLAR
jgi:hypothetical protein